MDIPPVFVESVTKDRHINPALMWWFITMATYIITVSTLNYAFQQIVLRRIHKRLFRRFGKSYPVPPPAADEPLTSSVTPQSLQQARERYMPQAALAAPSAELPPDSATGKKQQ